MRAKLPSLLAFILHLTRQDFTERYSGSVLGVAWTFILPVVQMAIWIVVFGSLMGARLPGSTSGTAYPIYLISGVLPWTAFANTILRTVSVFVDRKNVLSKIHVPLALIALPIALSEALTAVIGLLLLTVFVEIVQPVDPLGLAVVLLALAAQQLLAYAVGLGLAVLFVFIRDVREAAGVIIQLWFWATPLVYTVDILPRWAAEWIARNPVLLFIDFDRAIFLRRPIPWNNAAELVVLAGVACLTSLFLVRLMERDIRDFI